MSVHIIKLCVGIDSIDDLTKWQGRRKRIEHWTRMTPKRDSELLDGGSIYWIIRGRVQVRQKILALDSGVDDQGVPHCVLVLDRTLVPVVPRPHRPFQGWRYLDPKDAPKDLGQDSNGDMPEEMAKALAEMGLI